jgi:hypothetical protein
VIGTVAEDYLRAALGLELWPSEAAYGVGEARHSPDLWAAERRLVVEVKAALAGRRWYLTEAQLRAYLAIGSTEGPAGADWPLPAPLISYALVAYQLPQPPGRYRDAVALYRAVHPDTAAAGFGIRRVLILPVEVLEHTTREWGTSQEYTTPLSPMLGTWAPYRRAPPGRLWALWGADPAEAYGRGSRASASATAPTPAPGEPLPTMTVPFRVIRRADGVRPHAAAAAVAGPWSRSPGAEPQAGAQAGRQPDDWDSPADEDW